MAWSKMAVSRRSLDAVVALCAVALVVSGTALVRAWHATADVVPTASPNPDLVDRCGVPVILALDDTPTAPGGDAATAAAVGDAAAAVATQLSGRGSSLAALAYGNSVRWLTGPSDLQVPVEGAAAAPGGSLSTALAAYATPPAGVPTDAVPTDAAPSDAATGSGRNWEGALDAVASAVGTLPTDQPVLVLHITVGAPDRHLSGPGDDVVTTVADPEVDLAEAAAAAENLRSRPATHLVAIGVGPAAALPGPLSAVAGSDVVTAGSRPLLVDRDDVVTVTDPAALAAVAGELAAGLCATDVQVTVNGDGPTGTTGQAGVTLTLGGAGDQVTDDAGTARWRVIPPVAAPGDDGRFALHLSGGPSTAACGQRDDQPVVVSVDATGILLDGLLPGTTVTCELRDESLAPSGDIGAPAQADATVAGGGGGPGTPPVPGGGGTAGDPTVPDPTSPDATDPATGAFWAPLAPAVAPPGGEDGAAPGAGDDVVDATRPADGGLSVRDIVLRGAGAACPTDDAAGPTVAIAAMGETVTHCLAVRNTGDRPVSGLVVESEALGLLGEGAWRPTGPLAPTDAVVRRIEVPLERMTAVQVTARGGLAPEGETGEVTPVMATTESLMQVAQPAVGVSRALAVADSVTAASPCGTGVGHVRMGRRVDWCITVTNRGGTYLDEVAVTDEALSPTPIDVPGRLAPGASTTIHGSARLAGDGRGGPVPVARVVPVQRSGKPVGDGTEVASDEARRPGLNAEAALDALHVANGEDVTMSVTVSNDGDQPIDDIRVDTSLCGEGQEPTAQLFDNGDDGLDYGEQWVYVCSATVFRQTMAVASVVAPAQSTNTRPTQVTPNEADMRVKKSQRNDLRIGAQTAYLLKIQNLGTIPATDALATDPLPPGTRFVSASSDSGSCQEAGGTVTCQLGTLPPQQDLEANFVTIVVEADAAVAGQIIANEARVSTSAAESDFRQNTSTVRGKVFVAGDCEGSRDCDPAGNSGGGGDPSTGGGDGGGEGDLPLFDSLGGTVVSGSLATTGREPLTVMAWGMVLMASGLSLLVVGRRRMLLGLH